MVKMNAFEKKVLSTVQKYKMIEKGDRVLVGFSGGKDSCVLLYTLNTLSKVIGFDLAALHVNHGIRGGEALRDEEFAKKVSKELDIHFFVKSFDIPSLLENSSLGLEALAREVRYKAFFEVLNESGFNKIATAHTLSDNTETLLMTLFRSGTPSPIPPIRDNIVRPLIEVTTEEVLEYAENKQISYVLDSTNLSTDYLRNYLRHDILKSLRERVGGVDETLLKAGKINASLTLLAKSEAEKFIVSNSDPYRIDCLENLVNDISRHSVLFWVLDSLFQKEGIEFNFDRFEKILSAFEKRQTGKRVSVGKSKYFCLGYDRVYFDTDIPQKSDYRIDLHMGENKILSSPFSIFVETEAQYVKRCGNINETDKKINKLSKKIYLESTIMNNAFYARSRKTGDEYVSGKMTRNVKKYMIDAKIPSKFRHLFPVVCDEKGIVWVAGLGVADRLKTKTCENAVVLSLLVDEKFYEGGSL